MFLPTSRDEMKVLGWDDLDIILVTGAAYIDSPHIGVALVGKALHRAGFRVGVISQPDIRSSIDIMRLGEPALFWGITAGSIDSMVANYTPLKKRRKSDDYTPGGLNTKRPDRAVIIYANLIRQYANRRKPLVLGGIEASLRRIAHYDFWSDSIRRSILFDAKADVVVYGMGEYPAVELARRLKGGEDIKDMPGICYISRDIPDGFTGLPSFEEVSHDPLKFTEMFHTFYRNNVSAAGRGLYQRLRDRYLVPNPPWPLLTAQDLDATIISGRTGGSCGDRARGAVKAWKPFGLHHHHRGCWAVQFCSIPARRPLCVSRSEDSIN
jgi:uncharacterized radical SAM protein YgiQ